MNLFFLISFFAIAALFAAALMALVIGKELAAHFKHIRRRVAKGLKPLADPAILDRAAARLNRAVLRFEPGEELVSN